jgi:hypothetical protein
VRPGEPETPGGNARTDPIERIAMLPRIAKPGQLTCIDDDCSHGGRAADEGRKTCNACGGRLVRAPEDVPARFGTSPAPAERSNPAERSTPTQRSTPAERSTPTQRSNPAERSTPTQQHRPAQRRSLRDVVEVNQKVIRINHQVYPLRNIARIQSLELEPRRARNAMRAALVAVSVFLVLWFLSATSSDGSWFGLSVFFLAVATIVALTLIGAQKAKYVCALETNGRPSCVLSSSDPAQVDQLVEFLVSAIEHPPAETITQSIANFTTQVFGDQINQSGSGSNVGKVHHA